MNGEYFTTREIARLTGLTQGAIALAVRRGELKAARVKYRKRIMYEIHVLEFERWNEIRKACRVAKVVRA